MKCSYIKSSSVEPIPHTNDNSVISEPISCHSYLPENKEPPHQPFQTISSANQLFTSYILERGEFVVSCNQSRHLQGDVGIPVSHQENDVPFNPALLWQPTFTSPQILFVHGPGIGYPLQMNEKERNKEIERNQQMESGLHPSPAVQWQNSFGLQSSPPISIAADQSLEDRDGSISDDSSVAFLIPQTQDELQHSNQTEKELAKLAVAWGGWRFQGKLCSCYKEDRPGKIPLHWVSIENWKYTPFIFLQSKALIQSKMTSILKNIFLQSCNHPTHGRTVELCSGAYESENSLMTILVRCQMIKNDENLFISSYDCKYFW